MRYVLCAIVCCLSTVGLGAERKTSFVVVLCDDLGYGDLGCFGHPHIRTPHLDQLARDGWKMTDCYAGAPVCSPSRAALLTGRIPNRLGVYDWIPPKSPMHLKRDEITVASLLRQAGYQTCHVGKWHCNGLFNSPDQPQPSDHGFDHWFSTQNNAIPSHKNPQNFVRNGKRVGPLEGYSSQIIVDEALNWLNQRDADRPFLLMVWLHAPHEPVATAAEYTERYHALARTPQEASYFGNVTQIDHEVGRLLHRLNDLQLTDNTLVYFTSDNGPETLNRYLNATSSYGSPGPLRGMKLHMYEGGLRVPGILRWPGHTKPGTVIDEPIACYDILPTFCAIAGIDTPRDRALDGTNLLPLFSGAKLSRQQPLYWQYDRAIGGPNTIAVRDGDWKLLSNADLSKVELYNLRNDRSETHDVAGSEPARVGKLFTELVNRHREIQRDAPQWPAGPGTSQE